MMKYFILLTILLTSCNSLKIEESDTIAESDVCLLEQIAPEQEHSFDPPSNTKIKQKAIDTIECSYYEDDFDVEVETKSSSTPASQPKPSKDNKAWAMWIILTLCVFALFAFRNKSTKS